MMISYKKATISIFFLFVFLISAIASQAAVVTLHNGVRLEGALGKIGGVIENPFKSSGSGPVDVKLIVLIDDGLRRVFVSKHSIRELQESEPTPVERMLIKQPVQRNGKKASSLGTIFEVTEFDKWGRRRFTMQGERGPIHIIQGITEITPKWTKIESLAAGGAPVWDMRMSTGSLSRAKLNEIMLNKIDMKNPDQRLQIVRLYLQSKRYNDAKVELENAIRDFPELKELQRELKALRQLSSRQLLNEIKLRRDSGQYLLAYKMLSTFPDEGVAGETLLAVREMLGEYDKMMGRGQQVLDLLDKNVSAIKDIATREQVAGIVEEIHDDLNVHNIDRFVDFMRLADDTKLKAEQKVALAVSGWILGSGNGTENLAVANSLVTVSDLVRDYLLATDPVRRGEIRREIENLEGGTPSYIALILANMKPPGDVTGAAATTVVKETDSENSPEPSPPTTPDPVPEEDRVAAGGIPGMHTFTIPGLKGHADITYHVQLPPEYNPYKRYPMIVTLNGGTGSAKMQLDWWSGLYNERMKIRMGQGARRGYIVISPEWMRKHQVEYEFSPQEHASVLFTMRDACKRFSVDTDRVFLSGHGIGGNAAWDIGLAHPDLWAGVAPVVATFDKYIKYYWENAKYVSLYFICGEMDGKKMAQNASEFDRYLERYGFDTMVVQYKGRGHEHFGDDVQNLFDWMDLQKRDFSRDEFEVKTMRLWDNFFWWAELSNMPPNSHIVPANWPTSGRLGKIRPATIEGRIIHLENRERVLLKTGGCDASVWLSPDFVDFDKPIEFTINNRTRRVPIKPEVKTILEDARSRCDRIHPFWATVSFD